MHPRLLLLSIAFYSLCAASARADVVVLANRSTAAVTVLVQPAAGKATEVKIAATDVVAVPTVGGVQIAYMSGQVRKTADLKPNTAHAFDDRSGQLELVDLPMNETPQSAEGTGVAKDQPLVDVITVPVKVFCDEDQQAVPEQWQKRARWRVEEASKLLEKYCRIKLEIVAFDQWNSDNQITDFNLSLKEFENEVKPAPGAIAIGFTSQYEIAKGPIHLGGTRGPLHPYVLIREYSPRVTDAERLEILAHELGHVFGAAHSADGDSVMRPNLGDSQARRADFVIKYDPANLLAMNLVSEELRARKVKNIAEFSAPTNLRLRQIYGWIAQSLPNDPAAGQYLELSGRPLVAGARFVIEGVSRAARANSKLAEKEDAQTPAALVRRRGDALTEYYVRQAAWTARELPESIREASFVLALGIAMDDSDILLKLPNTAGFLKAVESDEERAARIALVGKPTLRGRRDLAQHFFVSGFLTAAMGNQAAETAGVAKEFADISIGSGFSFCDLTADKAGVLFGTSVLNGKITLLHLANEYTPASYMPSVEGLPEGLDAKKFEQDYGSLLDDRFLSLLKDIRTRLAQLPPYAALRTPPAELKPAAPIKPAPTSPAPPPKR